MNIFEYINFILSNLGLPNVMTIAQIEQWIDNNLVQGSNSLIALFNPVFISSFIFYLGCFIAFWQFALVLPYRYIKKIVRFPSKKGCEY